MTQEELDTLMNGDVDLGDLEDEIEAEDEIDASESEEECDCDEDTKNYRPSAKNPMPPPVNQDHKVVHQLDDVTKESEEKATQIFDIIETIGNEMMEAESKMHENMEIIESNIALFETLGQKFPNVEVFQTQLEKNREALTGAQELIDIMNNSNDSIMNVMDIMQYQDIHRQKIERVINVMRALSTYMNALFEGRIDDDMRVSSATHLPGDTTTHDVVSSEDIEALLASFGQK